MFHVFQSFGRQVSEFLDYHVKPSVQSAKSYKKESSNSLGKFNELSKFPENAFLVIADVLGLYPMQMGWKFCDNTKLETLGLAKIYG